MLPVAVFLFGWCRWWVAALGALALAVAWRCMVEAAPEVDWAGLVRENRAKFACAALLLLAWTFLSGIGGYAFQTFDHLSRNGSLVLLVDSPWPVVDYSQASFPYPVGFVYYFFIWLIPALAGKLFGLAAAKFALFVWAYLGVLLFYLLVTRLATGKVSLFPAFAVVFFSGLDVLGALATGRLEYLVPWSIMEYWNEWQQISSNTTSLFWVYNQALAAWLATALVLSQENNRAVGMVLALAFPQAPFPALGLAPIALARVALNALGAKPLSPLAPPPGGAAPRAGGKGHRASAPAPGSRGAARAPGPALAAAAKGLLSPANVLSVPVFALLALFVTSNLSATGMDLHFITPDAENMWLVSFVFECFLGLALMAALFWRDPMFYVVFALFVVCTLLKYGMSPDICYRGTIPSMVALMAMFCRAFQASRERARPLMACLVVAYLAVAGVSPFHDIARSFVNTRDAYADGWDPEMPPENPMVENGAPQYYCGRLDTAFWEAFAKALPAPPGGEA
jgi:hypothetical protein